MKRRMCSYDMVAVPKGSYVLKEDGGEIYFAMRAAFLYGL